MGTISGITKDSLGNVCRAMVRAYRRDTGEMVGWAISDQVTGAYSISTSYSGEHTVVRLVSDVEDGDAYWDSTVLAAHFEGSTGDTVFSDLKGHTLTGNGGVALSSTTSAVGTCSLYVDSNSKYVTVPASSDFVFGTGDFTIEAWVYVVSFSPALQGLVDVSSYNDGVLMRLQSSVLEVWVAGTQNNFSTTTTTGQWWHVAVCRKDGYLRAFIGGDPVGATIANSSNLLVSGIVGIGSCNHSRAERLNGYLNDVRITKSARYTSSFTPVAPFLAEPVVGVPTENAQVIDYVTPV